MNMITESIAQLSTSEKILLVQEIWGEIVKTPDEVNVSESQKKLLDEAYGEYLNNPSPGRSWAEVKKDVLSRL